MTSAPIRSMTGYGEAEQDLPFGRLRVEVRTVNHRHLNVQMRVPSSCERYQNGLERALKEYFARGHVRVTFFLIREGTDLPAVPVTIDVERARGYLAALRTLQEELELEGRIDLNVLAWFPNLFREADPGDGLVDLDEGILRDLLAEAARKVVAMREEEGARMARDLFDRIGAMESEVGEVERRAPERLIGERDRLREAIRELLDTEFEVDEERLAREVAYLAERWDIHEEVVRFRSHLGIFRETLENGSGSGVGKRLGFIAQELLREANTIGAKANDAEVAARVLVLKEEIERLREQVENIE